MYLIHCHPKAVNIRSGVDHTKGHLLRCHPARSAKLRVRDGRSDRRRKCLDLREAEISEACTAVLVDENVRLDG